MKNLTSSSVDHIKITSFAYCIKITVLIKAIKKITYNCCLNSEADPAGHDVQFPLITLVYNCALPRQRIEEYYSKPAYYSLLSHLPLPHTSTTASHFSQESCWADEHGSDLHCVSSQQIQHHERFQSPYCSKTSPCPLGTGR